MPGHRQPGATPAQAVRDALAPTLCDLGLLLEDVTLSTAGSRRVLRVVIDSADASAPALSLDEVADASRSVSERLDAADVLGQTPYVLEVSTPGVDRPLTQPRHFRRNVGRRVRVTLAAGTTVEGRVQAADDALVLAVRGAAKGTIGTRVLEWPQVTRGLVQVEFSHREEGS